MARNNISLVQYIHAPVLYTFHYFMTSKYWCFTINNPEEHLPTPQQWLEIPRNNIVLLVYQLEKGDNETLHFQGYVEFSNRKKLSTVKNINKFAHWELRRGNRKQAIDYCMKEDTRVEDTEPFIFGDITDIEDAKQKTTIQVRDMINSNKPMFDVSQEFFGYFISNMKNLYAYKSMITPPRNWKTEVTVIWGPTGTGKSSYCHTLFPEAYWKSKSEWWDGYDGQETVIIDEFYGWLPYDYMLRLLDRYPMSVEIKGSHVQFLAKRIIITSNKSPLCWYKTGNSDALLRRIDNIWIKDNLDSEFIVEKGNTPTPLNTTNEQSTTLSQLLLDISDDAPLEDT